MGNKIPIDMAAGMGLKNRSDSIFAPSNKYGYQIHVGHPAVQPLYEHYKRRLGEQILSDAQRFEFESIIFQMLERNKSKGKEA